MYKFIKFGRETCIRLNNKSKLDIFLLRYIRNQPICQNDKDIWTYKTYTLNFFLSSVITMKLAQML